jgi:hypothetical protein
MLNLSPLVQIAPRAVDHVTSYANLHCVMSNSFYLDALFLLILFSLEEVD